MEKQNTLKSLKTSASRKSLKSARLEMDDQLQEPLMSQEDELEPDSPSKSRRSTRRLDQSRVEEEQVNQTTYLEDARPTPQVMQKLDRQQIAEIKDVPNNTDRAIDFTAQMTDLKRRTEAMFPYTHTQTEDAMYIDQQTVCALEFHYYQNDCEYVELQPCDEVIDEDGNLVDMEGNHMQHHLYTQKYQPPETELDPMDNFPRNQITNFEEVPGDYLKNQKNLKKPDLMRVEPEKQRDDQQQQDILSKLKKKTLAMLQKRSPVKLSKDDIHMIEPIIALYRVNMSGKMIRLNETSVNMGRKFFAAKDGNMTLIRSTDKRCISLVNFENDNKDDQFFKLMAWTIKLNPFPIPQCLNDAMSDYYKQNFDTFDRLVEVRLVCNCKMAMLQYIEIKDRSLEEQQDYELEIDQQAQLLSGRNKNQSMRETQQFNKRKEPRRAPKYVFFDIQTGELMFEYGGVHPPEIVTNMNDEQVEAFVLGVSVKEIREESFDPKLIVYVAGDFLDKDIKKEQFIHNWAWLRVSISLYDIASQKDMMTRIQYINSVVKQDIPKKTDEVCNYYLFPSKWILQQRFNWEMSISCGANRRFDQILMLNQPVNKTSANPISVMVNGPKFRLLNKNRDPNKPLEVPYFAKAPDDAVLTHGRNIIIKDCIFYKQTLGSETRTMCLRLYEAQNSKRVVNSGIGITNILSQYDTWLHQYQTIKDGVKEIFDVFQTISVSQKEQTAVLSTRMTVKKGGVVVPDDDIITRYTKQFYQNSADLPFIAYNLGGQKIILQSVMKPAMKKAYIIKIPEHERFLGFVDFNSFVDIGFYPKNLKIECCSHFTYLTTARDQDADHFSTKLNLLLADPFTEQIEVALFQSKGHITNGYFKESDQQMRSCIQANMVRKHDPKFNIYLWTQFPSNISRSKFMLNSNQVDSDPDDVDSLYQKPGEEDIQMSNRPILLPIPMIQDSKDFIYYVKNNNGVLQIYEGNPRDPYEKKHTIIFEQKADGCFAFSMNKKGDFFLMDSNYDVYHLARFQNNRNLWVFGLHQIKEIQRLDFNYEGIKNTEVALAQHYSIHKNKIFYLYDDEKGPFPNGIMESEELIPEDRTKESIDWYKGPFFIRGSNRVYNLYTTEKYKSFIKISSVPDTNEKVIVNDFMNSVDFSSFMPDGKILIRVNQRFMIFNQEGAFIQEIHFVDDGEKDDQPNEEEDQELVRRGFMTRQLFLRGRKDEDPIPTLDVLRKGKPTILNFLGLPFKFGARPQPPTIDQQNKMELLQMSPNHKFFLFVNLLSSKLFLYELQEMGVIADGGESFFKLPDITAGPTRWELKKVYELKTQRSHMFQQLFTINVDPIPFLRENKQLIDVDDDGKVKLTYVENLPQIQGSFDDPKEEQDDEDNLMECRVLGAFFLPQDNGESLAECFMQNIKFPVAARINLKNIVNSKISKIERKITTERQNQCRLPPKLFDYGYYETLIEQLDSLELKKCDQIYSKIVNENLLIVWSGSIMKYTKIKKSQGGFFDFGNKGPPKDMNQDLELEKLGKERYLTNIDLFFDPAVEIIKIMETQEDGIIQIITYNHDEDVTMIVTWDFNENVERNMLQVRFNENNSIGYNVVKGMNNKMNYLIEQSYITDLEYNIPLWQANVDQGLNNSRNYSKQLWCIDNYDQVKIFQDNTRFLGVEKASCLYSQNTRLDTHLWQNLNAMGEKPKDIAQSCTLDSFNMVFDGCTIFHYFAANALIIEEIHQAFLRARQNGVITSQQTTLPLQILNPDLQGRSALYLSLQSQSPKSFECMVDMLKGIEDRCITKMMLKSLAVMLSHENIDVVNFFNQAFYQPPLMKDELFVPWNEDMPQFVFPCHTSVVTPPQLLEKLEGIGINIPPNATRKKKAVKKKQIDRKEIIMKKKQLKKYVIEEVFDTGLAEGEEPLKRVKVEALDFDWLFDGDNAKTLLRVLANDANDFALTQRSIKVFIELMWSHYQTAIIKYIFIPYIVYMLSFVYLTGVLTVTGLDNIKTPPTEADKIAEQEALVINIWINIIICFVLFVFYAQQEIKSIITNGFSDHFGDVWNTIDAICLSLVLIFLILCSITFSINEAPLDICTIRTIGGFGVFFMWIKVFYWMRLFPSLAYYVNLIKQTVVDVQSFLLMCIIILSAFANFFYVLNNNFKTQGLDTDYFDTYYNIEPIDSLLSMYELGVLGNYDVTLYRSGDDMAVANAMFFFCTFMITVVFMNMVIAIMGDTFGQVLEVSEQRGLREQIVLIDDHSWLLNLKTIFARQKYIIIVEPAVSAEEVSDQVFLRVQQAEELLIQKVMRLQTIVSRKVDQVDSNNRYMSNRQNDFMKAIMERVVVFESNYKKELNNQKLEKESLANGNDKVQNEIANDKRKEIMNSLVSQLQGKVTVDTVYDIALAWMEVSDTDKNGFIDRNEFSTFFNQLNSLVISAEEIEQIFDEFDESGDNQLSVEEFAKAIMRFFISEGEEDFSQDDEGESAQNMDD